MAQSSKLGFAARLKSAVATMWHGIPGIPADAGDGAAYNLGERIPPTISGQFVCERSVMQLSAAWACVSFIADTAGTLPFPLYRRTENGRVDAREHPLFRVLSRQPNADQTAATFWSTVVSSMLLRGVAYIEKKYSAGNVIAHEFLHPDRLSRKKLPNGNWQYTYVENGKTRTIAANNVMRMLGFSLDGETPCSAIRYGAQMFGNAQAAETAAANTMKSGLLSRPVFTYPTVLQEKQRNEAREAIKKISGAMHAGDPVILEAGVTTTAISISPADAQLLESRHFSVEEICSWFRMQPWMIGRSSSGQTNWGTGLEQQMIAFVTFTLMPLLKRIEQSVEKDDLKPEEKGVYYAEFAVEGLLRGDSAARANLYASALQNGWMNRSQVAKLENLPPIPGGDIHTVQSNLVPLDQLGAADVAGDLRNALENLLAGKPGS